MDKKYQSGNGFMTSIWGPNMWFMFHMISFNYSVKPTVDEKNAYFKFFNSIQHILPCGECRKNLKKNLKKLPFTMEVLESRYTLSKWVYDLHEEINDMLGKKSNKSFDDVRDLYELFRAKCGTPKGGIEAGCTDPLNKLRTKCVLTIVPQSEIYPGGSFDFRHCF